MNARKITLLSATLLLATVFNIAIPLYCNAKDIKNSEQYMNNPECGKMYVWGREVQDEPYNRTAKEARCRKKFVEELGGGSQVNIISTEEMLSSSFQGKE